ncbi:MAG: YihY/virulence factor BrkB family protein [Acidobacteriaceae bacterium]
MLRAVAHLRRAVWAAFGHSVFSMAKAAAYSAMLSVFPALVVVTTLFAVVPSGDDLRGVIRSALEQVLPPDTMLLVQNYFINYHTRSIRIVWGCAFVSLFAAMGVLLSLMEGFRRAYRLPRGVWGFWQERFAAVFLVPGTMLPMAAATVFLAFGHSIENWMINNSGHELHFYVIWFWRLIRWAIALLASVMSIVLIYHFGLPRHKHPEHGGRMAFIRGRWRETLPGATIATVSWFLATLLYGWYVTRFADYAIVYGSLGAGIATLVWLYMVSLSVLIGAEFNAQLYPFPELRPVPVSNEEFAGEPDLLETNPPLGAPHAARSVGAR